MGHSTTDHPEVRQAAARVRDAAHSHGKFSGHFAVDAKAGIYPFPFLSYLISYSIELKREGKRKLMHKWFEQRHKE